jgi:uncharacterized protein YjdB
MSVRSGRWIVGAVALTLATGACEKTATSPTTTVSLYTVVITGTPSSIGATSQFTATAKMSDDTTQDVTGAAAWVSSDTTIATVSSSGLVEGLSAGPVKITATYQSLTGTYTFTVGPSKATITAIVVGGSAPSTGATSQFTATAVYSDGSSVDVTSLASWTSSNSAVATVSSGGVVTGVAPGAATISATYHSVSGSTTFNVGTTLTVVVVSGTAPAIDAGNQFTAMARFADGSIQDVTSQATWTSSNTDVATVSDGGLVTGVAAGVVTISAKYQTLTGSARFNIVGS